MTSRTTPTLPGRLATTVPLAAAVLVREGGLWYWQIVRCPHCGRRHHHGGGSKNQDPRDFLGPWVSHCGTGWREYWLVDGDEAPARVRRRTRGKVAR